MSVASKRVARVTVPATLTNPDHIYLSGARPEDVGRREHVDTTMVVMAELAAIAVRELASCYPFDLRDQIDADVDQLAGLCASVEEPPLNGRFSGTLRYDAIPLDEIPGADIVYPDNYAFEPSVPRAAFHGTIG